MAYLLRHNLRLQKLKNNNMDCSERRLALCDAFLRTFRMSLKTGSASVSYRNENMYYVLIKTLTILRHPETQGTFGPRYHDCIIFSVQSARGAEGGSAATGEARPAGRV